MSARTVVKTISSAVSNDARAIPITLIYENGAPGGRDLRSFAATSDRTQVYTEVAIRTEWLDHAGVRTPVVIRY